MAKLCPEMDISMKKENKRCSLKQTIYSGRLCKETEVLGGGKLCSQISPVAGEGEGSEEWGTGACTSRCVQHSSVLWSERDILRYPERDIHGAAAVQNDAVGDQQRFWLLPPCLVLHARPAAAQPRQHLRGDEALLYLTQSMCPGSINLPTVALD